MSDMLVLPANFDDYEWEATAKGYFQQARLIVSGNEYQLTFYDEVRLGQTMKDVLKSDGVFFEPNLVVVGSVTRIEMERAAKYLVQTGHVSSLVKEKG